MNTMPKVRAWTPATFPHRLDSYAQGCVRCITPQPRELSEFPLALSAAISPEHFVVGDDEEPSIVALIDSIPEAHWGHLALERRDCTAVKVEDGGTMAHFATAELPTGKTVEIRVTTEVYFHDRGITPMTRATTGVSIWERLSSRVEFLGYASTFTAGGRTPVTGHFERVGRPTLSRTSSWKTTSPTFSTGDFGADERLRVALFDLIGVDCSSPEARELLRETNPMTANDDDPEIVIARTIHSARER